MTNKNLTIGLVIALFLSIGGYIYPKVAGLGAASGYSHYQKESFLQGLTAGARDQFSLTNAGVLTTSGAATLSSTMTVGGLATMNAGLLKSYTNASSSVGTGTLKESDILGYDTFLAVPTGAAATKTLTFPATSTLTSFVPNAGDRQQTCFFNATTTAATTITFAAGTGIDLEVATSTAQTGAFDLVLSADAMMCFEFLRKPNTDIVAGFVEYNNAD